MISRLEMIFHETTKRVPRENINNSIRRRRQKATGNDGNWLGPERSKASQSAFRVWKTREKLKLHKHFCLVVQFWPVDHLASDYYGQFSSIQLCYESKGKRRDGAKARDIRRSHCLIPSLLQFFHSIILTSIPWIHHFSNDRARWMAIWICEVMREDRVISSRWSSNYDQSISHKILLHNFCSSKAFAFEFFSSTRQSPNCSSFDKNSFETCRVILQALSHFSTSIC